MISVVLLYGIDYGSDSEVRLNFSRAPCVGVRRGRFGDLAVVSRSGLRDRRIVGAVTLFLARPFSGRVICGCVSVNSVGVGKCELVALPLRLSRLRGGSVCLVAGCGGVGLSAIGALSSVGGLAAPTMSGGRSLIPGSNFYVCKRLLGCSFVGTGSSTVIGLRHAYTGCEIALACPRGPILDASGAFIVTGRTDCACVVGNLEANVPSISCFGVTSPIVLGPSKAKGCMGAVCVCRTRGTPGVCVCAQVGGSLLGRRFSARLPIPCQGFVCSVSVRVCRSGGSHAAKLSNMEPRCGVGTVMQAGPTSHWAICRSCVICGFRFFDYVSGRSLFSFGCRGPLRGQSGVVGCRCALLGRR